MKRVLYSVLSLAAVAAIGWLCVDIAEAVHERRAIARRIHALPDLEVKGLDSSQHRIGTLGPRGSLLLFFRTTCTYCREEIQDLTRNVQLFDGVNVILLSAESPRILQGFFDEIRLPVANEPDGTFEAAHLMDLDQARAEGLDVEAERAPVDGLLVAIDDRNEAAQYFGVNKIPAAFAYDAAGKLVKRFEGVVRASTLAAAFGSDGQVR